MTRHARFAYVLAGLLVGLANTPSFAASRCWVPSIRTFDNQTAHRDMIAPSGRACTIRFRSSSGPMYAVNVLQRPRNGTVRTNGRLNVTYQSRPGYVGRDAFTYARQGQTKGGAPSTQTVTVAVSVR